jgi:hypothetical protein
MPLSCVTAAPRSPLGSCRSPSGRVCAIQRAGGSVNRFRLDRDAALAGASDSATLPALTLLDWSDAHYPRATLIGEPSGSTNLPHSLVKDGRLRLIPRKAHLRAAVLGWVVGDFAWDRTYTEPEVNAVLGRRHNDVATLRRYLVDAGLLCRTQSGNAYWRASRDGTQRRSGFAKS